MDDRGFEAAAARIDELIERGINGSDGAPSGTSSASSGTGGSSGSSGGAAGKPGGASGGRLFSGAACGIWVGGRALHQRYAGSLAPDEGGGPVGADSLFDLASLTKPLCTAILAMRAREAGLFPLDATLGSILPESAARDVPLGAILAHAGGLPAVPALERLFPDARAIDPARPELAARAAAEAERGLLSLAPVEPWGRRVEYSCTGYMLLGLALRRVAGKGLGELFRDEIAAPLGLRDAAFLPPPQAVPRIAATELCPWRGRRLRGEVHDESAFCVGGAAGNAGLFATLREVRAIAAIFLNGGRGDPGPDGSEGARILGEESVRLMTACAAEGLGRRRAIGFAMHDDETQDGPSWPAAAFGHTGYTGTSVFVEPGRRLLAVALTNRVYYGRESTAAAIGAFRRALHGEALAGLDRLR